jgi:hypothetical protein
MQSNNQNNNNKKKEKLRKETRFMMKADKGESIYQVNQPDQSKTASQTQPRKTKTGIVEPGFIFLRKKKQ